MAIIEQKNIHFKTYAKFKEALDAGNIPENAVVYIKDTEQVYTHGEYYGKIPSHGMGTGANAEIFNSLDNIASEVYAHAEGGYTEATGFCSHAEGSYSQANGNYSHAEGLGTIAKESISHAEGDSTEAIGRSSHTEGEFTVANNIAEHAQGAYNKSTADADANDNGTRFSHGIGDERTRKNALEIMKNGDIYFGTYNVDPKAFDAATKKLTLDVIPNSNILNPITLGFEQITNISESETSEYIIELYTQPVLDDLFDYNSSRPVMLMLNENYDNFIYPIYKRRYSQGDKEYVELNIFDGYGYVQHINIIKDSYTGEYSLSLAGHSFLTKRNIKDTLDSTLVDYALSANQGRVLNNKITALTSTIDSKQEFITIPLSIIDLNSSSTNAQIVAAIGQDVLNSLLGDGVQDKPVIISDTNSYITDTVSKLSSSEFTVKFSYDGKVYEKGISIDPISDDYYISTDLAYTLLKDSSIVDNLTTAAANQSLSANQGKILGDTRPIVVSYYLFNLTTESTINAIKGNLNRFDKQASIDLFDANIQRPVFAADYDPFDEGVNYPVIRTCNSDSLELTMISDTGMKTISISKAADGTLSVTSSLSKKFMFA